ncbi:DUF3139 domain-containing protein [Peribacillus sp. SCS-155]|uniref:DUF3139 domain-containing protein n=1 Tax=Peribacillus sedimenti TaxID=3115297 RepID=UPI003905D651
MKKNHWVIGLVVVVIAIGSFFYFSQQRTKADTAYTQQLKKDVEDYLINEKNYNKDDIAKLVVEENKLKGKKRFEVAVTFKDDKDSVYNYNYVTPGKRGKVEQTGISGTKHEEK